MKHLLILRPPAQADELEQMLQRQAAAGRIPVTIESASMLAIQGYDDPAHSLIEILSQPWDGALMVSVNAAQYFAQQAHAWAPGYALPRCRWYAVGPVSAAAIANVVQQPVTCPWREHNSDALLKLPELQQVKDQRWLIVRGHGGRELFADTMRARGAQIEYLEVYQRITKTFPADQLQHWQQRVDTILVSSAEQLGAFLAQVPSEALPWLTSCQWVVASERLKQLLPTAMQHNASVADSAASFAMVEAWQRTLQLTKEV